MVLGGQTAGRADPVADLAQQWRRRLLECDEAALAEVGRHAVAAGSDVSELNQLIRRARQARV